MKLTAVKSKEIDNRIHNKNASNINFKGFADAATIFWTLVDAGGRGAQFTVEDMLGTNFPRTYKGAMAGYEYTGKINWASVKQEGIREFLTGPTMVGAPIVILAAATKMCGKTSGTHCENITNLSHLAMQLGEESMTESAFEESFLKIIVEDVLNNSAKNLDESAKTQASAELIEGIKNYRAVQNTIKNAASKTDKKEAKKTAQKLLDELVLKFESILKAGNNSYKKLNFQNSKYSINENTVGETNFKNYLKYIDAYIEDYIKTNGTKDERKIVKLGSKAIESFEKSWLGKRMIIASSMIVVTGILMSMIPKLYTLASGGVNPNAVNIYEEAKKKEEK